MRAWLDQRFDAGANAAEYLPVVAEWLRAHPEAMAAILEMVQEGALDDQQRLRAALFFGLGYANTPETRALLMTMFNDPTLPDGYSYHAALTLAQVEPPPPGFTEGLLERVEASEGMQRAAMQLAAGAFAQRQTDEAVAAPVVHAIAGWLDSASSEAELIDAMLAATNAQNDAFADALIGHLGHQSDDVRQLAAQSLRTLSTELAVPAVVGSFPAESNPTVRAALLDAIASHQAELGEAVPESVSTLAAADIASVSSDVEYSARVRLLGYEASRGNDDAATILSAEFARERAGQSRNLDRLRLLGTFVGTRVDLR